MDDAQAQQGYDDFFEEVFCELEDKVILTMCDINICIAAQGETFYVQSSIRGTD